MLPVVWLESFSEEEETVKRLSSLPNEFQFIESPVQDLDPSSLPEDFIATIRTHSRFTQRTAGAAQCVISRSTGYDHLLEQQGILNDVPTGHLSEYATDAVAEHNLTVSLALLKDLNRQQNAMDGFERSNLTAGDLTARTVGIVGVGNIGEATAELFLNLNATVRGHDIEEKNRLRDRDDFRYTSLSTLFETCDLVVLCLPHTDETENMISPSLLGSMPEKSLLVNAGRGEVVSSMHLLEALQDGPLAGIGLDVYNREDELAEVLSSGTRPGNPPREVAAGLQLIEDDRVLATPHNAFNTHQALEAKVRRTLKNIETFNESLRVLNPVG